MTNREELFAIWIIKQISLVYKEPTERNKKKDEQPKRRKGKGYEKTVWKGMQISNKHMKRCSNSFIIKDMQIK